MEQREPNIPPGEGQLWYDEHESVSEETVHKDTKCPCPQKPGRHCGEVLHLSNHYGTGGSFNSLSVGVITHRSTLPITAMSSDSNLSSPKRPNDNQTVARGSSYTHSMSVALAAPAAATSASAAAVPMLVVMMMMVVVVWVVVRAIIAALPATAVVMF